jgi:hypothetical protein
MLLGGLSMNIIGDLKSLGPLRKLWINLANNHRYTDYVRDSDKKEFLARSDNEGLAFLTRTLPTIGKALDLSFSSGEWVNPPDFSSGESDLPTLLGDAVKMALGGDSQAVDCVRQLTYMFYKLEVEYEQELVSQVLADFEKVDFELASLIIDEKSPIIREAKAILARILCNSDPRDIRPRHGSGASACRTRNSDKWHHLRYFPKLDAYFPYPDYFFYSPSHLVDEMARLEESVVSDPVARVCLVPKDSRGPRIISCEPAELMYFQQGLMQKLYCILEANNLTRGQINFSDQTINQQLAKHGSIYNDLATLDLSEASDRVSLKLVEALFPPNWFEAFEACRSEGTLMPSGKIVKLNKFAPMGSACCFPVEAMVFWSIAQASVRTSDTVYHKKYTYPVYVYGDDIIVPTSFVGSVIDALQNVGLKVNVSKSYINGPFRESCGGDYHNGYDVTPVRVRSFINASSSSFVVDCDLANELFAKFGMDTNSSFLDTIEECYERPFPRTELPLPGTIRISPGAINDVYFSRRWNNRFQRFEHRIPTASTKALALREPAWCELLRKELTRDVCNEGNLETYENPIRKIESSLPPGYYAETHSAVRKWDWVWLG